MSAFRTATPRVLGLSVLQFGLDSPPASDQRLQIVPGPVVHLVVFECRTGLLARLVASPLKQEIGFPFFAGDLQFGSNTAGAVTLLSANHGDDIDVLQTRPELLHPVASQRLL